MSNSKQLIDKLLTLTPKWSLPIINKVMSRAIPFNRPHAPKIITLTDHQIQIELPNKRVNHNHLRGIHACAMATVGEYAAGMLLVKNFGIGNYRLIMRELRAEYFYQGKEDILATANISKEQLEQVRDGLKNDHKTEMSLETIITNQSGKDLAKITTTWQLKDWQKVQTK